MHNLKHDINVIKALMCHREQEKHLNSPFFFYEEILSPKEPNRPQKVVTSGCEVITSGPKKMREKGNSYIWHTG